MVNNQDESLMAFLGDKVRSWTPKVMALGVVLACLATSLAVSGDQTSVTGWANPEWQDTVERQISTEDPDLLILDPGFSSNYSAYDPESLEWVQKTCEQRLDAGKSILILDSAFTPYDRDAHIDLKHPVNDRELEVVAAGMPINMTMFPPPTSPSSSNSSPRHSNPKARVRGRGEPSM